MMKTTSVNDYYLTYATSPLSNWEFSEDVTNLIEPTTPEVVVLDANTEDGEEPGRSGLQVKKNLYFFFIYTYFLNNLDVFNTFRGVLSHCGFFLIQASLLRFLVLFGVSALIIDEGL